ncbi:LOW QUALITY PROTEIN: uncharacterized protein LOC124254063 [Haliotis rubra]|uniref:LOW QUALITY PROTEIN: uncharacterized protein LOC124254063 n=1 Tax=Haliotis rubra TaxID=36100 RepID=UPI001EE5DAC5|nr:LOW QUALITY PROTEIN: uncharacterized protein LOC124254063 [Haliotis rubra]
MKAALLLQDSQDAYKMGDGNRLMQNAKFQMLLSDTAHHTNYKIWLFRYMAYYFSLLSPRLAEEYKWNCTANTQGGIGNNIPNDNLVEVLVKKVKKICVHKANATYATARTAALTTQIQDEICTIIEHEAGAWNKKGSRSKKPNVLINIPLIVQKLQKADIFSYIPGRSYAGFPNFQDLFARVNVLSLHKWITDQKNRLSLEII